MAKAHHFGIRNAANYCENKLISSWDVNDYMPCGDLHTNVCTFLEFWNLSANAIIREFKWEKKVGRFQRCYSITAVVTV